MSLSEFEDTSLLQKGEREQDKEQLKFPLYLFPSSWVPYLELARVEKPTGFVLMFWPFAWGLTMAAYRTKMPPPDYWRSLARFLFSAIILRTSACTVNDILDRKLDAGVERTKRRPLPSGRIFVLAATVYLLIQYALGLGFFGATLSGIALYAAVFQLLPLFAIYPLLKRLTYWPQAWLGFAMNFGFITAWVASTGYIETKLLGVAMAACWCWTMIYDTVYACQDIADDIKMGAKSTAILFGSWIRPLLGLLAFCFIVLLGATGALNKQGLAYFIVSVGCTAGFVVWQMSTVCLATPESCWSFFERNGVIGLIIWAGLYLDYFLAFHYKTSLSL